MESPSNRATRGGRHVWGADKYATSLSERVSICGKDQFGSAKQPAAKAPSRIKILPPVPGSIPAPASSRNILAHNTGSGIPLLCLPQHDLRPDRHAENQAKIR